MSTFRNSQLVTVRYETVREAMQGEMFPMELVNRDEIEALIEVVNLGIDSHLEACFVPTRGDSYGASQRVLTEVMCVTVFRCEVSPESMPVLLRRLMEHEFKEERHFEAASNLQSSILEALDINEYGRWKPTE